jgi:hypothetical protein
MVDFATMWLMLIVIFLAEFDGEKLVNAVDNEGQ